MAAQELGVRIRELWIDLSSAHLCGKKAPGPFVDIRAIVKSITDYAKNHPEDDLGISPADIEVARIRAWRLQARWFWEEARKTRDPNDLEGMQYALLQTIGIEKDVYDDLLEQATSRGPAPLAPV